MTDISLTTALADEKYVCSHLQRAFLLSPMQARVARLTALRMPVKEIAAILCISPHTVRHHREIGYLKLGVHTGEELRRLLADVFVDGSAPGSAADSAGA